MRNLFYYHPLPRSGFKNCIVASNSILLILCYFSKDNKSPLSTPQQIPQSDLLVGWISAKQQKWRFTAFTVWIIFSAGCSHGVNSVQLHATSALAQTRPRRDMGLAKEGTFCTVLDSTTFPMVEVYARQFWKLPKKWSIQMSKHISVPNKQISLQILTFKYSICFGDLCYFMKCLII